MKKISLFFFILCFSFTAIAQMQVAEDKSSYRKGELLVLLHNDARVDQLVKAYAQIGLKAINQISPAMNVWRLSFDTVMIDGEDAKYQIVQSKLVQIVQFNHSNIKLKNNMPNDSLYAYQWDMDIISATQAWAIDSGGFAANGRQIVIASVDGGFDISHPDLNVWHNANEIPGNAIDDDNNGYTDDYRGWNASLNNDSIPLGNGHGTATIGISSAHGDNHIGISGVCWNVQAMAIATDIYNEATVIGAYGYIFAQRKLYNQTNGAKGAFIVSSNSSFGPSGYGYQYPLWNAMYDSMGSVGILSAGATSNDPNCDVDTCPDIPSQCASRYTVIVTGTNSADVRHGAYGAQNVDLAAPGNGSYTIYAGAGYGGFGGTSAASPHVAGAIALMWSAACSKMVDDYKLYPDSMALVMKNYLLNGVDTMSALSGKTVSGGRLNLFKALTNVLTYDCRSKTGIVSAESDNLIIYPNPSYDQVTIKGVTELQSVTIYDALGRILCADMQNNILSLKNLSKGVYTLDIRDQLDHKLMRRIIKE